MLSRTELQAQLEEADKRWGLESLYYFSRFVLGYDLLEPEPHKEVSKFAEDIALVSKRGLDLEPRGAFKTTIFSQALPIWMALKNPNIRILLDSEVLQNSIDNLGVIKRHLEHPRFQFFYGDLVGQNWTTESITFATRTRHELKEPSIRVASPERVQTGPHYDLIIGDDLVSKDNVGTPEQRNKIKDHIRLLFSLLDPGGVLILIGTRWHYEDPYQMILDEYPQFKCRVKSAETGGPSGGLYFPQRLSPEFLTEQRTNLGRDLYNSQYLNDPAPEDEQAKFQKSWFKRYDILPKTVYSFVSIDPGGEKKGSDDWVFFLGHCDEKNDLYFDRISKGNLRVSQAWDILFDLYAQHKFTTCGLEVTGGQKYLLESLNDEMRRRNVFFNVVPLTHAVDSKEFRILRLQPRYQCGSIYHSAEMGSLEEQLRRFPKGKDDIADAAAMILEISVSPRSRRSKSQEIRSVDDLIWREVSQKTQKKYVHPTLGGEV